MVGNWLLSNRKVLFFFLSLSLKRKHELNFNLIVLLLNAQEKTEYSLGTRF